VTTDVERAVGEAVAAGMLEPETPPPEVPDLVVSHARSLDGIEAFSSLETLSLIGCQLGDYSALSQIAGLRVLVIENSDLFDAAWAGGLGLQVAILRRCRLRDVQPVARMPAIQYLDLTGNPLNEATRAVAERTSPGRVLMLDDVATARLNVDLADAHTGIVAYRVDDQLWACATGLELTSTPEAGHVPVAEDDLRAVVQGSLTPRRLLGLDDEGQGG
jgi:hypothetical protein